MADTKGNDPKPSDTKGGPVKPPVLDLKARETDTPKPEAPKEAPKSATASRPGASDKAAVQPAARGGFAFGAALAGGLIGLGAAYGLAWFGLWPTPPAAPVPPDPRLAQFATAIPELETVTQTTQTELSALNQRLAALESAEPAATPAAEPVDLTAIEADVAALAARIDGLATPPAPPADEGAIERLRMDLAAMQTRLDEVAARLGTAEAGLRDLDSAVTQASATLASQPSDIGAVLQLPLILSGLETAFATGRPYEAELAALRAADPQAPIPTVIANGATAGIARPDAIASRFQAVLPAMLAGRPADPNAQWQDGALDWFRSAIALRPTGEMEGDSPEAVMSRLEAAIARRDFVTAEDLLQALPEPMRAAGEDVPELVAVQAEAARFLETLRRQALSGEAAQ